MYKPIDRLLESEIDLGSPELSALSRVWKERREHMAAGGAYRDFLKRLQREWAIETGIIERLYTWDRGVTEALIEQGIEAAVIAHHGGLNRDEAEHIKDIIDDQLSIVENLFAFVRGDGRLTEHFIRSVHAQFTAHQVTTEAITPENKLIRVPLIRGDYKKTPNNPRRSDGSVHEYCPPELVRDEMEKLVRWYSDDETKFAPEIISAWLHHKFAAIHPFQDGNGRVARTLASLVFLKAGLFPVVMREADRDDYISALEEADRGNLSALVGLFSRRQRDAILMALGLEQQAAQARHAEQIISAAIVVLKDRFAAEVQRVPEVYATADRLRGIATKRLQELSDLLNDELRAVTPPGHIRYSANVRVADNNAPERTFFYNQIIEVAKTLRYFANVEKHRSWTRLAIKTETTFEFVVSLHGYGHGDTGVMAASALCALRVPNEDGPGTEAVNTRAAAPDLFQFNYAESAESTERRFMEWLEAAVAIALAEWRRQVAS